MSFHTSRKETALQKVMIQRWVGQMLARFVDGSWKFEEVYVKNFVTVKPWNVVEGIEDSQTDCPAGLWEIVETLRSGGRESWYTHVQSLMA
jgi:hypothetical protein